ncbi:MAG: NAD(P)H-binding protein [Gemmatimonadetes bacterium]|nr:SDR family oxidoreductase [Gemmatimonadota bacterium]NIQ54341.1 SDR family oxidoreductase [Gemmatimonadota bacterium]NIU74551.1 NAD(P)H-binding protein [Gammaproteobacteria bacterium]NIX44486.1 NAD(P)H-binding protein [Gemmatimonadota bacterium]NIY08716.1 NAD(P)H-binding protein [Gemmatimonadota bacterium]
MEPETVLIAGCGYVGTRLAELLVRDGHPVLGLRRDPSGLPEGVLPVAADVSDPATLRDLPATDAVVYAVAPGGRSDREYRTAYVDGLRNVLDALARGQAPGRVVLVSSTGVYGQADGRWVDEDTPPEPPDATAERVLEGEAAARARGAPGIVLRLGGIYGPGRTRTVRRVVSGEAGCPAADRYGNRIHRDDAAAAIRHLLHLPDPAPVYLGVDRAPAPLRDVYRWIADRAGVPDPCRPGATEAGDDTGRRGSNKRCSSRRLVDSGFVFSYPTYREGYRPMIDAFGAGGDGE